MIRTSIADSARVSLVRTSTALFGEEQSGGWDEDVLYHGPLVLQETRKGQLTTDSNWQKVYVTLFPMELRWYDTTAVECEDCQTQDRRRTFCRRHHHPASKQVNR